MPKRIVARYTDGGMDHVLDMFNETGSDIVRAGYEHTVRMFEGTGDVFCVATTARDFRGNDVAQDSTVEADFTIACLMGAISALESLGLVRSSSAVVEVLELIEEETEEVALRRA